MHFDGLDVSILGPAFVAGLLVLSTHVPMGLKVLERGIVFIDLAIAQIAGVGIIAADTLGFPLHGISVQLIGIYLVFASLIVPALAVLHRQHLRLPMGYVLGVCGYGLGLMLSALLDIPAGAAIVCCIALIAATFSRLFTRI